MSLLLCIGQSQDTAVEREVEAQACVRCLSRNLSNEQIVYYQIIMKKSYEKVLWLQIYVYSPRMTMEHRPAPPKMGCR